jgi:hypothetical protein
VIPVSNYRPSPLRAFFNLMLLQPLALGRMRWTHFRQLVRVLILTSSPVSADVGLTNTPPAAARDDDRGDRRGGRDDFLSNRRASSIPVTRLEALNQLTFRNSSGQTGLSSEGGSPLAYTAPLHSIRWESGFRLD